MAMFFFMISVWSNLVLEKLLISLDLDAPARVTGLATAPGAEVAGTSPGAPQGKKANMTGTFKGLFKVSRPI